MSLYINFPTHQDYQQFHHKQYFAQFYESSSQEAHEQTPNAPPKKTVLLTKLKQNTLQKRPAKPTHFATFTLYMAAVLPLSKLCNVTPFQQCRNKNSCKRAAQLVLETQDIIQHVITARTGKLTQKQRRERFARN
jgi:hypothetical protein